MLVDQTQTHTVSNYSKQVINSVTQLHIRVELVIGSSKDSQ